FSSANIISHSGVKIFGVIEATRGCPYRCDFCQESNVLYGSIFRTRPKEDVIKEIKSLSQRFLFFCDASMTIDVSYTKALFKSMKDLNKKFICEGNADVLAKDEELLKLSYEAGCIEWTVGFESLNQQTLNGVHKKTNKIEDYALVVEKIHKYKMAVLGNFIFGFDQDNPDVFEIAQEDIIKLGLDSARFAILTPYPGTPLFKKLEAEGRILTRDWSKYNRKNVVFEPKNMSKEDLQNGFIKVSSNINSIPNLICRDFRSLKLGFHPFLATVGRNVENYLNTPRK
ncbi:MAG: B12-binding domain-containing radical SAM protein, partial [Thermoplasmatales archaeon]